MQETNSAGSSFSFHDTFLRKFSGTFLIRVFALAIGLVVQVVLARFLGTEGYGTFSLAFTIPTVAGMITAFGFSQYLVREVAAGVEGKRFGYVAGLLRYSFRFVILLSLSAAGVLGLIIYLLNWPEGEDAQVAVLLGLSAVPIYALINQRQGALSGLHRVEQGQLPENFLRPVLFLSAVVLCFFVWRSVLTEVTAVILNLCALVVAVSVGGILLARALPAEVRNAASEEHRKKWLRGSAAFMLISGMSTVQAQTDIIMIGAIKDQHDVGVYVATVRLAGLITYLFFASNLVIGPAIARLWERRDMDGLQQLVKRSSRLVTLLTFPLALALAVFPRTILAIFGDDFGDGAGALSILSAGWFLNVALGPVTYLLSMTGHERLIARIVLLSTVLNIALNAVLIPTLGIEGAAISTGVSFLVWKGSAMFIVKQKTGISANALI
jgi:O-antigen/teichoic acid export membrane protein